jgi:hypothetical protein
MLITSVEHIKAADIINTAEQLKRNNLLHTSVSVNVHDDHISVVDPSDDHLLSYIKRDVKSSG